MDAGTIKQIIIKILKLMQDCYGIINGRKIKNKGPKKDLRKHLLSSSSLSRAKRTQTNRLSQVFQTPKRPFDSNLRPGVRHQSLSATTTLRNQIRLPECHNQIMKEIRVGDPTKTNKTCLSYQLSNISESKQEESLEQTKGYSTSESGKKQSRGEKNGFHDYFVHGFVKQKKNPSSCNKISKSIRSACSKLENSIGSNKSSKSRSNGKRPSFK